jgi:hypothetical protein
MCRKGEAAPSSCQRGFWRTRGHPRPPRLTFTPPGAIYSSTSHLALRTIDKTANSKGWRGCRPERRPALCRSRRPTNAPRRRSCTEEDADGQADRRCLGHARQLSPGDGGKGEEHGGLSPAGGVDEDHRPGQDQMSDGRRDCSRSRSLSRANSSSTSAGPPPKPPSLSRQRGLRPLTADPPSLTI